jgi:hypothetical protein
MVEADTGDLDSACLVEAARGRPSRHRDADEHAVDGQSDAELPRQRSIVVLVVLVHEATGVGEGHRDELKRQRRLS